MKNISIVIQATNPLNMKHIVENSRAMARYPREVQWVFIIDPANKPCVEMSHELYSKYPPDMWDVCTLPKVKGLYIGADYMFASDVYNAMIKSKCDAKTIVVVNETISGFTKNWDQYMIEIIERFANEPDEEKNNDALRRIEIKFGFVQIIQIK